MSAQIKIVGIDTLVLHLPTIRPHSLSMVTMRGQTLMLVRIRCSDGTFGLGEGTTIGGLAYGPECPEGMKLVIDRYITPMMMGMDATNIHQAMVKIRTTVRGNHFAKCAIECALLDAHARRLNVSMSELLGGRMRESLPVAWTLASGDTEKDIEEAQKMLELRRHKDFKLKIGNKSVSKDVAHVAAIRKALPDHASVRVDVNMAWSEREALRGIQALADAGCELVEQPVTTVDALARLQEKSPIALMADEILVGPQSALTAANMRAADVFSIKIEQAGGLFAAANVMAIANAAGISSYGGTMLEGPIGTIAAAHLFASCTSLEWGTELFGPLLLTEEILTEPLQYGEFELKLPSAPGLGISLTDNVLAQFDEASLNSQNLCVAE